MTLGEKEKDSKMKKWKKDNLSTMTYLVAKLSPEILQLVKDKKTAYEMWEKLEQSYNSNTVYSAVGRLDQLLDYEYKSKSDIQTYLGGLHELVRRIKDAGGLDLEKLHIAV
ncbi:hypothetical protein HK101_001551, partial [Irineochytrium annulatum]